MAVYSLRRPPPRHLAELRRAQAPLALTYDEVGASLGAFPAGYDAAEVSVVAGRGRTAMLLARQALRRWAGHHAAGIVLEPEQPPIAEGEVVALAAPLLGLWVTSACRIVRVVDDDDAFGFAYGTLPHHVEVGEESFTARLGDDGTVRFEVRVLSRPATRLARLGGPVSLRLRDRVLRRYAVGLAGAVVDASP